MEQLKIFTLAKLVFFFFLSNIGCLRHLFKYGSIMNQ